MSYTAELVPESPRSVRGCRVFQSSQIVGAPGPRKTIGDAMASGSDNCFQGGWHKRGSIIRKFVHQAEGLIGAGSGGDRMAGVASEKSGAVVLAAFLWEEPTQMWVMDIIDPTSGKML